MMINGKMMMVMKMGASSGGASALEWNASTRGEARVHARNCRARGRMQSWRCWCVERTWHGRRMERRKTCTFLCAQQHGCESERARVDACACTLHTSKRMCSCAWILTSKEEPPTKLHCDVRNAFFFARGAYPRRSKLPRRTKTQTSASRSAASTDRTHCTDGTRTSKEVPSDARRFSCAPRIALARVQRPSCQQTHVPSVCRVSLAKSYTCLSTYLCLCSLASLALALHDVASTVVASRRRTTCDLEGSWNVVSSSSHVLVASNDAGWRSPSVQATCTCAWRRRTCSA